MPLPQPKVALNNACSVIFNNTLYSYSADAFQSLRLAPGAEWEELPQGEKITGGVCVGSTTGTASTSAFFVVGGTGGTAGYQGLQKYTYAAGRWETVKLASAVTNQRLGHNAVYLNSTDSILVFGGTQDGSHAASSQTFTVGASAPYSVTSYDATAPASLNPILLPWSTSEAVMVGGSTTNTKVMLFSQERNWTDSGASLAAPLAKDTSSLQAVLMTGDDGSKNLITFDMSVSPNAVKRTVLFSAPNVPVPNAVAARRRALREEDSNSKQLRSTAPLNVYDWPAYNSTLAPKSTRTRFSLAQAPDGSVVISGGNEEDVLCMFDCRQNSWEDASSKLAQFKVLSTDSSSTSSSATATSTTSSSTLSSSSSTSLTSSATFSTSATPSVTDAAAATQTATTTAVPTVSDNSGPPLNTILGAVLGGFFGLAIALILAYFCIRRQRRRRAHMEAGHLRRASGMSSNEKGGIGFTSNGLSLGQGPRGVFRGHQSQGSENSFTAILMGRNGQKSAPSALSRKSSNDSRRDSGDSTFRAFKSTISKPFPQASQPAAGSRPSQPQPPAREEKAGVAFAADTAESKPRNVPAGADRRGSTRRSSGWNRYWSGGSALNLLGFGSGNGNSNNNAAANNANSRRTTLRSENSSHYSDLYRMTQDSATVPPLFPAAAADGPRMSFSRVHSHSPTIAVYNDKLKEGLSGRIESSRPRPVSALSDASASAYSSGIPESVHDAWDPTAANRPWGADRALNTSFMGMYSTALTPASAAQGSKQQQQAPVRDDMSWLNLGPAR